MTQTKKLVFATQRAIDKAVELHKAKGWEVVGIENRPTANKKTIFILNIRRQQQ